MPEWNYAAEFFFITTEIVSLSLFLDYAWFVENNTDLFAYIFETFFHTYNEILNHGQTENCEEYQGI